MNMNSHTCPTPPLSWECHTVASTLSLLYIDRQERSEVIGKYLRIQPEFGTYTTHRYKYTTHRYKCISIPGSSATRTTRSLIKERTLARKWIRASFPRSQEVRKLTISTKKCKIINTHAKLLLIKHTLRFLLE